MSCLSHGCHLLELQPCQYRRLATRSFSSINHGTAKKKRANIKEQSLTGKAKLLQVEVNLAEGSNKSERTQENGEICACERWVRRGCIGNDD